MPVPKLILTPTWIHEALERLSSKCLDNELERAEVGHALAIAMVAQIEGAADAGEDVETVLLYVEPVT